MPYRIITGKKIYIQYTLFDFIEEGAVEVVDCRTPRGRRRYKELFGRRAGTRHCARGKYSGQIIDDFLSWSRDIEYLFKIFNERDRRLFAGFLAITFGCGGVIKAAELTGLDPKTVRKGKMEIEIHENLQKSRVRLEGGGKPSKEESDPRYKKELEAILEDDVAGDPMSKKKWIRKTLRWIKKELQGKDIDAAISTIRDTLKNMGISLKKNVKSKGTQQHPDRNTQFEYLNKEKREFLSKGIPVISVDTKKKELIGNFKNDGSTWRATAYNVLDHDFPSLAEGKLIPFGVYDLKQNEGHVYCGTSSETSEFAVDSIVLWWKDHGQHIYPGQTELLILCDSGGANGYRRRMWKWELQTKLADQHGLNVHISHYPSGTSKYNPIERMLFSNISKNWAGEPLISYDKALGFICSTSTENGLKVKAYLVDKEYQKGLKVSDEQMKSLYIVYQDVCPKWNYTLRPRRSACCSVPVLSKMQKVRNQ